MRKLSKENNPTYMYKQKSGRSQRNTWDNPSWSDNLSEIITQVSKAQPLILLTGNA